MSEVSGVDQSGDHSPCASSQPGVGFAEPGAGEEMADNEEDGDVDDHDHEEENGEEADVDDMSEDWGWRQFIPSFLRDQRHPSPFGFHFINLHLLLSRKVIVVFAILNRFVQKTNFGQIFIRELCKKSILPFSLLN